MSTSPLRRAGLTVILFALAGRGLGFLREVFVAAQYGTTRAVDVYLAAVTIPAVIGTLLAQALPNAFVPLFSRSDNGGNQRRRYAWWLMACMGGASLAIWFLARPVAALSSSGFPDILRDETVLLLRFAAITVFLAAIEALTRSRLLAQRRFVQSGAAGLWPGLSMIAAIALFPAGGARTLVGGYIAGACASALWNLLPLDRRRAGPAAAPSAVSAATGSETEGRWILIVLALSVTGLLYTVIDRYFASQQAAGSIAALQYAGLLATAWVGIWGMAIGTAVFPYLSSAVQSGHRAEAALLVDRAVRWSLIASVPVAVWLLVFNDEIITIVYQRGAFAAASHAATSRLLSVYGLWLIPAVVGTVLGKLYYSTLKWRPLLWALLLGLAAKISLSYRLSAVDGIRGLAAATAASAFLTLTVLLVSLPFAELRKLRLRWGGLLAALTLVFLVTAAGTAWLPCGYESCSILTAAIIRVAAGVLLGGIVLLCAGPSLGIHEVVRIRVWAATRLLHRN